MISLKRFLSFVVVFAVLVGTLFCNTAFAEEINTVQSEKSNLSDYEAYLEGHFDKEYPELELDIYAENGVLGEGAELKTAEINGKSGKTVALSTSGDNVTFDFEIAASGLYNISLFYRMAESEFNLSSAEININIDNDSPVAYQWLKSLTLERVWADGGKIETDENGNESAPEQTELYNWILMPVKDDYRRPLYYYFESGKHSLTVELIRGAFELYYINIGNETELPSYNDYIKENKGEAEEYYEKIEAEKYASKSSASIVPECDPSNADTTPNDPIIQKLNYISGVQYKTVGDWVEWSVEVPNDGYYLFDMRVRQNYNSGLSSIRKLTIDGDVPFAEAAEISFPYSDSWKIQQIGDEQQYRFYLTKGKHTIRLTAVYGSLSEIVSYSQEIILRLNSLYNSVIMKIGANPDKYRDYNLDQEIKGIKETLFGLHLDINLLGRMVVATNDGKTGSAMSTIQAFETMLKMFMSDPDELAQKMNSFKSNIEALAAWTNSLNEQPLDIDWIRIYSENADIPSEKVSFFEKIEFDFIRLCASFSSEYNLKENNSGENSLTVWVSAGRDQLNVIKKLIDSDFKKQTGAKVKLAINTDITGAILAGVGPDLCLFMDSGSPVNFAVRDVLVDLTEFDTYKDIASRFDESALIPFYSEGGCYAIPLSTSWPMLFVREDIFKDLGITVPQTWDDMYTIAAVLQRNHLEIGIPSHVGMFFTFLYQNGGKVFDENLETTFHDEHSLNAFSTWCSFFSEYSFPLTYDFFNRFRSGEMPIGISDYTVYAQLKAAAPEIRGQWGMYLIPGVKDENGNINRLVTTSSATGTTQVNGLQQNESAVVMFRDCKNKELAWQFIDWFTTDTVQSKYGLNIEAVLGYTGRYATANKAALSKLPWSADEIEILNAARKNVVYIEEYPGNYYIAREINNAFRSVVNEGTNPADILSRKNVLINKELVRKYKQFGIKTGEDKND